MPYGHIQFHDTRHGNMSQIAQIESIGEDNESEYAGYDIHKQCCKDIGKHHHIDYSQNEENSDQGNDGLLMKKKDSFIMNYSGNEQDPYSFQEQKEFIKYEDSANIKSSKWVMN
ncbi:6984_t:CDS:2 [Funneliformis geosporum]|nr:6984_t:CDS:2 [Funneliformis geosporum]